ncbi:hypothetical protein OsJ_04551 [Oryza sativa Japonica Group]|uniref:Uncharacterized protein n=1 Tax=Oryza sativa subsp. japonica TaxID=39947 RepID=B9EVV9_ORYSJ|nr:hypothetical protein OsJ_04551 [Oryza sativa Japonica Group]
MASSNCRMENAGSGGCCWDGGGGGAGAGKADEVDAAEAEEDGGAARFQERRLVVVLVLPSQPMCATCFTSVGRPITISRSSSSSSSPSSSYTAKIWDRILGFAQTEAEKEMVASCFYSFGDSAANRLCATLQQGPGVVD